MKRTVKRILGIALSVMILLSLLPAGVYAATETDADKILTEAYALAEGKSLAYDATLTGKITKIDSPYNNTYKNISVIIEVPGHADKPMLCYRMKGDGADKLAVGDTITCTGKIKNYYGKIEFDGGCTLDKVVPGGGVAAVAPEDPKQIVDEAFALAGGKSLPYRAKLTGKIVSVDSPYDESYKNLTVTIEVEGSTGKKNIECYRLKGTGAETLKVGDVIVVEGIIQRYIKTDSETGDVITDKVEFNGPSLIEINPEIEEEPETPKPTETVYYLFGYINGADHASEGDSANMGNYKFVNGKVTAAFTADSYVGVKTEGNGIWYMTNGWLGTNTTTATLYDSSTIVSAEKLFVPANTVFDFVITENTDGTLTLSYTENKGTVVEPSIPTTPAEIVDAAYALEADQSLEGTYTLTGKITAVNAPYDASFGNITVTIVIKGREDKPIKCYRLAGEGADKLLVDDTITVTGTLTNYKGNSVQFAQGCTLDDVVSSGGNDRIDMDGWGPDSLALVGSGIPGVAEWNPSDPAADMTQVRDNVYEIILECPAGTSMKFKIAGNDMWIDQWHFGSASIVFGQQAELMCYGGSGDMALNVKEACTLRITVDLNPMTSGGNATILVEKVASGDTYRVVGNASWMGNWYAASNAGIMTQIGPNVYQKCFEDVQPGSYEFKITKDGKWDNAYGKADGSNYQFVVNSLCDVTVTLTLQDSKGIVDVTLSAGILGDVTGDGNINMGDLSQIYAHIRGTKLMSEQALLCADFNGDGKINMGDISNVYAYVRGTDPRSTVDAAYQLAENQEMSKDSTLTGTVIEVIEPYNAKYGCVTVKMTVAGREDYPILCSRLMGIDAENIGINDKIKVTGRLRNFYGTVEFKEGCQLVSWENVPSPEEEMAAIVDAAYALGNNESMNRSVTLTGKIVSVDQAYNGSLPYISVTIEVAGREGMPISCYRMVGVQIANVKKNDTVTVTGTLRNFYGTVEFAEGCRLESYIPGNTGAVETNPLKIVDLAYALGKGEQMQYDVTLTGRVTEYKEAYNEQYKSISVMFVVVGRESKPIQLYGLKGDGVASVAVNDTITVVGRLKNYNGIVEMTPCTMTNRVSGGGKPPVAQNDYTKIVDEAYALEQGASLTYTATLEGRIVELKTPYDAQYKNMTVVIVVTGREDKPIECYRMKGDNIGNHLCVGDTITVEGTIRNYNGTIEFDSGCQMTDHKTGSTVKPTNPKQIVDAAFQLGENEVLPYFATLTGTVNSIDEPYNDMYKNIILTMTVQGTDGPKDIVCYRLKGNGTDAVKVGNTITVTGAIKRYVRDKDGVHEDRVQFDSGCILESLQY